MFLWYKYLIVTLVFSHLGFWSGNLSLIAPFPDLCLLVPFCSFVQITNLFEGHIVLGLTHAYAVMLLGSQQFEFIK